MPPVTLDDLRASRRVNGAMVTVLSRQLQDAGLSERAAYAFDQRWDTDGGHAQRVLVATSHGLFDWRYEWLRDQAWTAEGRLIPWVDVEPQLALTAKQQHERGEATAGVERWTFTAVGGDVSLAPMQAEDTFVLLAFARTCLKLVHDRRARGGS